MVFTTRNKGFVNFYDKDYESPQKKAEKALHEAYDKAEAGEWADVIDLGLENPMIMDSIINAYYSYMPERIRYVLPLKWYIASGKASDAVCSAVKLAGQYKPPQWIGKGLVKGEGLEVFCCLKKGSIEDAKSCLSWAIDFGTAYVTAMQISGKVFKGYIKKENMLAYDENSVQPVIQYNSVVGIQQSFPVLPISCLERKEGFYGSATAARE